MNPDLHRLTLQILIGSAWIDHHLSEPEVAYLQKILAQYNLSQDAALQELLQTPVAAQQTERWIVDFLKIMPGEERLQLLAAIGNLLIADDLVSDVEHDLIDEYYSLMARIPDEPTSIPHLVTNVGHYVKKALQTVADQLADELKS